MLTFKPNTAEVTHSAVPGSVPGPLAAVSTSLADAAFNNLRHGAIVPQLYSFAQRIDNGNGAMLESRDHRFEAILIAVAQLLSTLTFELDETKLPDNLSKMDLDTLDRLFLAIGVELERRKTVI